MNKLSLSLILLCATALMPSGAVASSCCSAHAIPAAVPEPVASPSARSIYQLDGTWTTDRGETLKLSAFRGRPVVIAMFFASCEYACPILVNDMKRLRESLPPATRDATAFVLVSFDVARDTPAALRQYRERAGLDAAWTLLRGTSDDVQELAMVLGVKYKQDSRGQFSHSNLITVLNPAGEVAHQRTGLQGDLTTAARAIELAAR